MATRDDAASRLPTAANRPPLVRWGRSERDGRLYPSLRCVRCAESRLQTHQLTINGLTLRLCGVCWEDCFHLLEEFIRFR